jgi:hypothetical protein
MSRWSKAWQVTVEVIFVFPILLLLTAFLIESSSLMVWLPWLPLYGWSGLLLASYKYPRLRILRWFIAALGSTMITAIALALTAAMASHLTWQEHGKLLHLVYLSLLGVPLMLRGMLLYSKRWEEALPFGPLWLSLLIYIPACSIFPFIIKLAPYRPWLLVLGGIAITIGLLTANSLHLRTESRWGKKEFALASSMLRQNRILVVGLLVTAVILAAVKPILEAASWVLKMIVAAIAWLIFLPSKLLSPAKQSGNDPNAFQPMLPPNEGEANAVAKFFEIAVIILTVAGLLALVLFIFYRYTPVFIRLLWKGLHKLVQYLTARFTSSERTSGYTDETSSIFVWEDIRRSYEEKLKAWLPTKRKRMIRWEELHSNQEKVRFLFRKYIQRRIEHGFVRLPHHTPAQMTEAEPGTGKQLIELYHQVRYGDQSLDGYDAEIAQLKRSIDNK